jgi:uncharacterized protein
MNFEWDEQKNKENIRRRSLDFVDASEIFNHPMLVQLDTRYDYGEDRWIGIGVTHGRVVVIVFTEKDDGETIRIISMRKALKHEQNRYEENISY